VSESVSNFIHSREGWAAVRVVQTVGGGFDVVLVLDGHYSDAEAADEMRQWYADRLHAAMRREGMRPQDPGATYRYRVV
jgi:hypothetical protein